MIFFIATIKIPDVKLPEGIDYITYVLKKTKGIIIYGSRLLNGNTWNYIIFESKEIATAEITLLNILNTDIFEIQTSR